MPYKQLTREERYQIYALLQAGHNQSEVAEVLERDRSTICRELQRNTGKRGYRPRQAHMKAMERQRLKVRPRFSSPLWPFIEDLLRKDWSPDQISGRLKREHGRTISHETIYKYVYADKKAGGDLHTHLRCRKKRRKRYGSGRNRRGVIPNRTSIDERPSVVDERKRIGDWEGDTIIGRRHKGALVSVVERSSLFTLIKPVNHKSATAVTEAVTSCLEPHSDRTLTLTVDNGKEFADHELIAETLTTDVYFAHPYASWERGINENTNGLLRQYFPKKRELTNVSQEEVKTVQDLLNHRPRKTLGYRTPHEVFYKTTERLTVAVAT
ncbi:MAG: IS30 family transposase [Candidatus Aegiribacteria sp.]|nr:IS30 family transposase [Candidatus Aegiribacteria sp.]MBD3294615.1 IS30 family transposase [Candidatus Fermentibacteria bacterium]